MIITSRDRITIHQQFSPPLVDITFANFIPSEMASLDTDLVAILSEPHISEARFSSLQASTISIILCQRLARYPEVSTTKTFHIHVRSEQAYFDIQAFY